MGKAQLQLSLYQDNINSCCSLCTGTLQRKDLSCIDLTLKKPTQLASQGQQVASSGEA